MADSEVTWNPIQKVSSRVTYPDAITKILNPNGSGGKLQPRTCEHTNTREEGCASCEEWLQRIDAGASSPEPSYCLDHTTKRNSSCSKCQRFMRQVLNGSRVPNVSISFNENIFSTSSSLQLSTNDPELPHERLHLLGPCNEPADLISLTEFREMYQKQTYLELFRHDLTEVRNDINRIVTGIHETLQDLFSPVTPACGFQNYGRMENWIRKWEWDQDMQILERKFAKFLRRTWTPRKITCKVSSWIPLQRSLQQLETMLETIQTQLAPKLDDDFDWRVDAKSITILRKMFLSPVQDFIEQGFALLAIWNAPHRFLESVKNTSQGSTLDWVMHHGIPLGGDDYADQKCCIFNIKDAEMKLEAEAELEALRHERRMRQVMVQTEGKKELDGLRKKIDPIIEQFKEMDVVGLQEHVYHCGGC